MIRPATILKLLVTLLVFVWLLRRPELQVDGIVAAIRSVSPGRFAVALGVAVAVKLVGILGNVWRWQVLLRGQALPAPFPALLRAFFIGRWFGVITPGTLGLDGYRIWDSARMTDHPAESVAVVVIDKVVGLAGLALVLLLIFPFGQDLLPLADPTHTRLVLAGLLGATLLALGVLWWPAAWRPLLRLLPNRPTRVASFARQLADGAAAYGRSRAALLGAVLLAVVGHFTTALMYVVILWGLLGEGVVMDPPLVGRVLWSALLMTCATLVAPTLGGEGVRELVFVRLLADVIDPSRAFLFGHVGFWIEKTILSIPGGIWWWKRRKEPPTGR